MPKCCYYVQSDGHVFRVFAEDGDCPLTNNVGGVEFLFSKDVDDVEGCYDCGDKLPVAYPIHKHHHYGHGPHHDHHGYGPHYDHGYGPHYDHGYGPHTGYGHHGPDPLRCFDTLPSLWLSMWCRACGWH